MVTRFGMSDVIGPVALVDNGGRPQWAIAEGKEYSETVSAKIDSEVSKIINNGMKMVEKILAEHKKAFIALAKKLIEVETLEREEFEKIIIAHGIMPKKKEIDKA